MPATAIPVVHIDDPRFKVTEWQFAPGAETGWHVHGHDYVIVPLSDGVLGLELPQGVTNQARLVQGVPYSRRSGVAHNVTNVGGAALAFLEVEVVDDALARRREAVLVRFAAAWNAHDVAGLMECMAPDCAFHASAGAEVEGQRHLGREAVQAAFAAVFDTFAQARWSEDQHRVVGNTGLSTWRFTGTRRDGQTVDVRGCDIFTFDGELIALKDSYRKSRS